MEGRLVSAVASGPPRDAPSPGSDLDPDGRIEAAIDAGHTLPSSWYTAPTVFALEQQRVFRRAWQYVGHRDLVDEPGDFFTCEVGGVPIVVVCGKDAAVRGFVNICRHRHHPVAVGAGNRSTLQCMYHAWTYKLDGSFNAAPRAKESPNFDGSSLCLRPVAVDFLGQMLFVNPSSEAPPLAEALGPIPSLARKRGMPFDTARFQQRRVVEFDANWKIVYDNNCECYHCPTVHKTWYKAARLDKDHVYSHPIGPLHFEVTMDQHAGQLPDTSLYCWPSLCLTSSGGAGKVEALEQMSSSAEGESAHPGYFAWRFVPVDSRHSRVELDVYCTEDLSEAQLDEWFTTILAVVEEDRDVCNRVQASHDSGVGEPGTLITAIDSEYHTLIWERLLYRALVRPEEPLYAPMLTRTDTWPVTHDELIGSR